MSCTKLSYRRGDRALVDDVSLRVDAGQLHCIVGPNGAGKSTLLNLLSGERAPHSGAVQYNDRPLADIDLAQRARIRAALSQRDLLSFAFSVEEVVRLGRMPSRRQGPAREAQIVAEAMQATDVLALRERRYTELSGGERARVQLARVLCQIWEPTDDGTRILLLDEPTASLDIAHQHRCLQELRRFAASGVAIVLVVHDLNLAMSYADQVTLLGAGRAVASGAPEQALTAENLEAIYQLPLQIIPVPGRRQPIVAAPL
ncbi:MAG TPA: heme ABC transporter ATP-binding protein [Fontimonas sp.]